MSFELNGYYKQVGEADISKELDCVNTLQKTQWRVNKYVLEVMEQCWNSGSKWEGLPAKDDLPICNLFYGNALSIKWYCLATGRHGNGFFGWR